MLNASNIYKAKMAWRGRAVTPGRVAVTRLTKAGEVLTYDVSARDGAHTFGPTVGSCVLSTFHYKGCAGFIALLEAAGESRIPA